MELLLLLVLAVMFVPMLLLSSRQRKAQKQQQELVRQLGVGDEVRTHSGFFGLIVEAYDDVVVLESEDGSQSKWARQAIAMQVEAEESADADGAEAPEAGDDADEAPRADASGDPVPGVTVDEDASDEQRRDRS